MDAFIAWFDAEYEHINEFFTNIIAFLKNLLDFLGERPVEEIK